MKQIIPRLLCFCLVLCMAIGAPPTLAASETLEGDTVKIAVITADVKAGGRLNAQNVELVEVKNVNIPPNVITNLDDVYAKVAAEDLYEGEYLYSSKLTVKGDISSDASLLVQKIDKCPNDFLIVTDYIQPNTGADVSDHIQNLIYKNGGRTLYFPDGEYVISKPLITSATPAASTTFYFAPNAVLKASDGWTAKDGKDAMICIGGDYDGEKHVNDNTSNGSYFGVFGGVLDCNNKADGIAIISSRESIIYGTTILNPNTGINIHLGANNTSSDADIENVNIIGCKKASSVGIYINGADNTITDVKIYDMEVGIRAERGIAGKNIQCFQTGNSADNPRYLRTLGIDGKGWLFDCYVENCATAYRFNAEKITIDGLVAAWTQPLEQQLAFEWRAKFNSRMTECRADFYDGTSENIFIKTNNGGSGKLESPMLNSNYEKNGSYKNRLTANGFVDLARK